MSKEKARSESRSAPVKLRKSHLENGDKLKSRANSTILIIKQNHNSKKDKESNCVASTVSSAAVQCPRNNIRRKWITVDRLNELRKKTLEAAKAHKTFTIRGCFYSIRNALNARGWVEKVEMYRRISKDYNYKNTFCEDFSGFPNRKTVDGEKQYLIKCERNLISRFLENMPVDFLWTTRKEKNDYLEQSKNGSMVGFIGFSLIL